MECRSIRFMAPPARFLNGEVFRLRASYSPTFPSRFTGTVAFRVFVPVTAAGQRRTLTGFLASIRL